MDLNAIATKYGGIVSPVNSGGNLDTLAAKYGGKPLASQTPIQPTQVPQSNNSLVTGMNIPQIPTIFLASSTDNSITTPLKTIGNIPADTVNFISGAINTLNPVNMIKNLGDAYKQASDYGKQSGQSALSVIAKSFSQTPSSAVKILIPQFFQKLAQGDVQGALKVNTENPVQTWAPLLLLAKAGADHAGMGAEFDNVVKTIASPVTKPISMATDFAGKTAGNMIENSAKFATSQATGLEPGTIKTIIDNPTDFSKENMATIDRPSLGQAVKAVLSDKASALKETGTAYTPIRESATPIKVSPTWLESTIKDNTGIDVQNGELTSSASSQIRNPSDVKALQNLYNTYQPLFDKGTMTPNEFLNMRTDLTNLSKFGKDIGKSAPLENLSKIMRGQLNEEYRPSVPGLDKIDQSFAQQKTELSAQSKGILDKQGNLTDTGINKIANATKGAKSVLLDQLEKTLPGITKKIQILKAVEDIQRASGNKTGTYSRSALGVGGLAGGIATGNIPLVAGSIAEMIIANPDNAVPLLQKYGYAKPLVNAVISKLKVAGSKIGQTITSPAAAIQKQK